MAANVAHYTATIETEPSIFEVIAQQSLNNLLHPAFHKFTRFLAQVNPNRFGWLVQYSDEVFLVLNGLLQAHYIRTTGASFAEYFYGLQRVTTSNQPLTEANCKLSLVFLVVLPYLKGKIDEQIQLYRVENAERYLHIGLCKRAAIFANSLFHVSYGFWTFVQYLRYLSNTSCHQTPPLQLLQLKLVYLATPEFMPAFWTALFRGHLSFSDLRAGLFQNLLEVSAFFMQFLQVWNTEMANYSFTSLPAVPPPTRDSKAGDFKGRCPICLQSYKIPTVLPVSGYVFCFPCIVRHLQKDTRCPVTQWPAKSLDVIRLYDSV